MMKKYSINNGLKKTLNKKNPKVISSNSKMKCMSLRVS